MSGFADSGAMPAGSVGALAALRSVGAPEDSVLAGSLTRTQPIANVDEALNVWRFEPVLRRNVNAGHYAYLAQGADDFGTIAAHRGGFERIATNVDLSVELFGQRYAAPIFLCPVGEQQMFHADGVVAAARAARAKNVLQVLSTVASFSVEDVAAARGGPGWFRARRDGRRSRAPVHLGARRVRSVRRGKGDRPSHARATDRDAADGLVDARGNLSQLVEYLNGRCGE